MTSSLPLTAEHFLRGLECIVCQEPFRDPRMLPCGHTLCRTPCLEQLADNKITLRCPECRTEHDVPSGGVVQFPKNVAISRQLDPVSSKDKISLLQTCPICREDDALKNCDHCGLSICLSCVLQHTLVVKEKFQALAVNAIEEANKSLSLHPSIEADAISYVNHSADLAEERVDSAKKQAIMLIEKKSKELTGELQSIRQKELANIAKMSRNMKHAWEGAKELCSKTLHDCLGDKVVFSSSKLAAVSSKIAAERERAVDTERALVSERALVEVDVSMKDIESAIDTFATIRMSVKRKDDRTFNSGSQENQAVAFETPHAHKSVNKTSISEKDISDVKMTFCTQGSAVDPFCDLRSIAVDRYNGDIVVVDRDKHMIQKFDSNGELCLCFGGRGPGHAQFNSPEGVVINQQSQMIISDYNNHRLKIHNKDGSLHRVIGKPGTGNGMFISPRGLALDSGDNIHICDSENNRIQVLKQDGSYVRQYTPTGCTNMWYISISATGVICIGGHQRCVVLDNNIKSTHGFNVEFMISGLCIVDDAHILLSAADKNKMYLFNSDGNVLKVFDCHGTTELRCPRDIAVDETGHIYVACKSSVVKF